MSNPFIEINDRYTSEYAIIVTYMCWAGDFTVNSYLMA